MLCFFSFFFFCCWLFLRSLLYELSSVLIRSSYLNSPYCIGHLVWPGQNTTATWMNTSSKELVERLKPHIYRGSKLYDCLQIIPAGQFLVWHLTFSIKFIHLIYRLYLHSSTDMETDTCWPAISCSSATPIHSHSNVFSGVLLQENFRLSLFWVSFRTIQVPY